MGRLRGLDVSAMVGRLVDVIPDRWEAHHRPTMAGTRTARVRVYASAALVFDEVAGRSVLTTGAVLVAQSLARVQAASSIGAHREHAMSEADPEMYDYLVTMEAPATVGKGCVVEVLAVQDAEWRPIVGRLLEVQERRTGSLEWETLLHCVDNLGSL